jgi:hypothetical protein
MKVTHDFFTIYLVHLFYSLKIPIILFPATLESVLLMENTHDIVWNLMADTP